MERGREKERADSKYAPQNQTQNIEYTFSLKFIIVLVSDNLIYEKAKNIHEVRSFVPSYLWRQSSPLRMEHKKEERNKFFPHY